MITNEKLDDLRVLIADESITLGGRTVAAEHAVQLQLEGVAEPSAEDPEVVELRTPWKADGEMEIYMQSGWRSRNTVYGWSADGPTLVQAKLHVHDRMKLRALLSIIVDDSAHRLERLEACRCVLGRLSPRNFRRVNAYTPERMLAEIKPYTAIKWGPGGKVPVQRPPRELSDVW